MNSSTARKIWTLLALTCEDDFLLQVQEDCREFTFDRGVGGKIYLENPPRIAFYPEHETPKREELKEHVNWILANILSK